ncbi:DUF4352 domain-containing protein [Listeria booriae]|uniref:DUF4352 domain-containing protein n=1 Tax=Listeria booriae TaxID=1552123 RepID=UPI0016290140|nr:DUF4352 domain-containing protein [Listeria booriae]MBC2170636.1 DUF4352 domain-containing protein [Listeria booriae]MBC2195372.1 DUF4352 domain-containing protein [Listeria booriae]
MKKILITLFATLLITTTLAGCGNTESSDLNKALGTKAITVTPTKVTREKAASDRKVILKVQVKVKNNSKNSMGIGSGNFQLKDDNGKAYDIYGMKSDNLGQEVMPGESIKGNIYFEIPADLEKGWMNYSVYLDQEPAAEWLLVFPK